MKKFLCLTTVSLLLCACGDNSSAPQEVDFASLCPTNARGTFIDDRDGHEYRYTTIGKQVWMAENLTYEMKYYNDDGSELTSFCNYGVYGSCYYPPFKDIYPDITLEESLCPKGWHVPSNDEIDELIKNVGGYGIAGQILKSSSGWGNINPDENSNGTDACGFDMKPGSMFFSSNDESDYKKNYYGSFMSSTHVPNMSAYAEDSTGRYYHDIFYSYIFYSRSDSVQRWEEYYHSSDFIRCVKD